MTAPTQESTSGSRLTTEAPLEPERPICDPHHHLWDFAIARSSRATCFDEILVDTGCRPQRGLHRLHRVRAMFKPDWPEALRPSARPSS
jgi:hypothetical protein